ncbi:MAG: hypothetical protein U0271_09370 [Polyangiaceae bacterium]
MSAPRSLRAFAERDWQAADAAKEAYWVERKRSGGPDDEREAIGARTSSSPE